LRNRPAVLDTASGMAASSNRAMPAPASVVMNLHAGWARAKPAGQRRPSRRLRLLRPTQSREQSPSADSLILVQPFLVALLLPGPVDHITTARAFDGRIQSPLMRSLRIGMHSERLISAHLRNCLNLQNGCHAVIYEASFEVKGFKCKVHP